MDLDEEIKKSLKHSEDLKKSGLGPKDVRKYIRKHFKPFAKEYGFQFRTQITLYRIHQNVLHSLGFENLSSGFTCQVAIQPLYYPGDSYFFNFGDRISNFKVHLLETWDYLYPEKGVLEILELVKRDVLPWFDKFGHPAGIIDFVENYKEYKKEYVYCRISPDAREESACFSYLYLGQYQKATEYLKKGIVLLKQIIQEHPEWSVDWHGKELAMYEHLLGLIQNDPPKIKPQLDEYIQYTKKNLKIE